MDALALTPLEESLCYVPKEPLLHAAGDAETLGEALFGGMPFQLVCPQSLYQPVS